MKTNNCQMTRRLKLRPSTLSAYASRVPRGPPERMPAVPIEKPICHSVSCFVLLIMRLRPLA